MTEKQRKKRLCIKWMCVIAWAVTAVFLSRQNGIATSELSYGISEKISAGSAWNSIKLNPAGVLSE